MKMKAKKKMKMMILKKLRKVIANPGAKSE